MSKKVQMGLNVPPEVKDEIVQQAAKAGLSVSAYMSGLITTSLHYAQVTAPDGVEGLVKRGGSLERLIKGSNQNFVVES